MTKIMPEVHRALITLDASDTARVLATDSAYIASEFDDYDTDAEEIGILSTKDIGPGFWLWTGKIVARDQRGYEDLYPEWVPDFEGETRRIELFDEALPSLLAMEPPEPADDDE